MPTLNDIVKINVDRQTAAVPQSGFGDILILGIGNSGTGGKPTGFGEYEKYTQAAQTGNGVTAASAVGKALAAVFSQDLVPAQAYVGFKQTRETTAEALDRILNKSNGAFYCVVPVNDQDSPNADDVDPADQTAVAEWVQSNNRIAFVQTKAADAYGGGSTDIGSVLKAANRTRTAVFWGKLPDKPNNGGAGDLEEKEFIAAAAAARCLPGSPGGIIWAYNGLNGVSAAGLTQTQLEVLDEKNYNYQNEFGGSPVLFNGKMADDGFIDLIRDTDWLVSRIREAMIFQLKNADKIPYTQDGADIILNALTAVLEQAVLRGVISDGYSTSRAALSSLPAENRANRKFPTITVNGRYAGAVQSVEFQLTLTV